MLTSLRDNLLILQENPRNDCNDNYKTLIFKFKTIFLNFLIVVESLQKKEEEEQWLRKQAKAKDRKQKLKDELQMDHDEIVKKCQHFFHLGDLDSAEEILNYGIELFPQSTQLLNNRIAVR